jgi:hypothetical protein
MNHKSKGFEYTIDSDPQGDFLEVYRTDEKGEREGLWLSIFINTHEGETVEDGIKAAKVELYDPVFLSEIGLAGQELSNQREALNWLEYAYPSIQDIKDNA